MNSTIRLLIPKCIKRVARPTVGRFPWQVVVFAPLLLGFVMFLLHTSPSRAQIPDLTPTPRPTDTPLPPNGPNVTPTDPPTPIPVYITDVTGRFFANAEEGCVLNVTTATPPVFTQQFPLINFSPSDDLPPACATTTPINQTTRPFTNVIPGSTSSTPCALQTVGAVVSQTPVLAGVDTLENFQAVYTGQFYVAAAGDITFQFWPDDGWTLAIGPRVGGSEQPTYQSGYFNPSPTPGTTPRSVFQNYLIVGRRDGPGVVGRYLVTVSFPVAGYYPFEVDYTECRDYDLSLTVGTNAAVPIPPLSQATPTPTFTCVPGPIWCIGSSQNQNQYNNTLNGVAAVTHDDVYAAGSYSTTDQPTPISLLEHWDGSIWSLTPVPDKGALRSTVAIASDDVWAVGDAGVIHWDGSSWSSLGSYNARAVTAAGAEDVWVVETGGIRHWLGTTVDTFYSISGGTVYGITAVKDISAWAVGRTNGGQPFILHWDGSDWNDVSASSPTLPADSFLNSIDVYSDTSIWAVGSYYNSGNDFYETLIEYYDGTDWRIVPSPNLNSGEGDNELRSVWVTTSGDVWAAGTYTDEDINPQYPIILHWTGYEWIKSDVPAHDGNGTLEGITTQTRFRPTPTYTVNPAVSDWAVGSYHSTGGSQQTLIEHISAPTPPGVTQSYYETQVTPTIHWGQGCDAAKTPVSGVIILDYGAPSKQAPGLASYGTKLLDNHAFVTTSQIQTAVKAFIDGYVSCESHDTVQNVQIAVSVNNCNYEDTSIPLNKRCPTVTAVTLDSNHGAAWAQMIENLQAYATASPTPHPEIQIAGGIDAEPAWDPSVTPTSNWLHGFLDNTTAPYYNFGSTDYYPCLPTPSHGRPTPVVPNPSTCYNWNADTHYQISTGFGSNRGNALPQIYKRIWAGWWYLISRWGYDEYNVQMKIVGQLPSEPLSSPKHSWQVLWLSLNGDKTTAQPMNNSTTIDFNP